MNAQEIVAKADRGEGLTEEEIKVYRQAVKPVKHTYGKYGTLKRQYLEEKGHRLDDCRPSRIPARHRPSGGRVV